MSGAERLIRQKALRFPVPCYSPRRVRIAHRSLFSCVSTFIRRFDHKQSAIIAPALVERRITGEPSRVRDAHPTLATFAIEHTRRARNHELLPSEFRAPHALFGVGTPLLELGMVAECFLQ